MSKSTTTHTAALKALAALVKVTADLEYRLASLAEVIELEAEVDDMLRDAGHALDRADRVLKDTAAVPPAVRYTAAKQAKQAAKAALKAAAVPAPGKGKRYRVTSVCEAVHEVYASSKADAYDRMMCGDGTLIESDTHDTSITLIRGAK